MTFAQVAVFVVLGGAMVLFVWNRWRYDMVAALALLAAVYSGIVSVDHAFAGFGHPAVITVACVLVLSKALQNSGVIEKLLGFLVVYSKSTISQIAVTGGVTALFSGFMNNIGALALMLPVTLRNARKVGRAPYKVLMPLSFASLLGGLITLIGTPPNIVIATFRESYQGEAFGMFDFTPVGIVVALVGMLFITTVGWRLLPHRRDNDGDNSQLFRIEQYVSEARLKEGSPLIGKRVRDLEKLCDNELTVMAIVRDGRTRLAPRASAPLRENDRLILEGDSEALQRFIKSPGLVEIGAKGAGKESLNTEEIRVMEAVVMPHARIEGKSMRGLQIHDRYGVNLLAVARRGLPPMTRLARIHFRTGDVLLLQGEKAALQEVINQLGCLPLAERGLSLTASKRALLTPIAFAGAVICAAVGIIPIQIAFATVVVILILSNVITLREAYDSIEWPVIVLLGCLIPVGEALQSTGASDLISNAIVVVADQIPVWATLALIIAISMVLSDLAHNTPTAVLMAPIAASIALDLNLSVDAFLMAVAIGAASPYLTPIGHQSNTLVMGPGGYNFADYWRMGLPLDIIIVLVAVPMIMLVWM